MLDVLFVRAVAAAIAVLYVAGAVYVIREGRVPFGREVRFRAEDPGPRILQTLWEIAFAVPNVYPFAVVLAPDWAYGNVLALPLPSAEAAQVFGLALWLAGGALVVWSAQVMGRHMITKIAVMQDHELITAGPYARIRHPTYLGVMLMAVGLALFFLSGLVLAFFALAVVLANYRARREERLLSSPAGFGDQYRAYVARTGRFLPRFGK